MMQSAQRYSMSKSLPQLNFKRRKSSKGCISTWWVGAYSFVRPSSRQHGSSKIMLTGEDTCSGEGVILLHSSLILRSPPWVLKRCLGTRPTRSECLDTTHQIYCRLLQLCQKHFHHVQLYSRTDLQEDGENTLALTNYNLQRTGERNTL